jgi:hypothetical protein
MLKSLIFFKMRLLTKLLTALIFCLITTSSFSQAPIFQPKKLPENELKKDFLFFRDTLQKAHAGLYRYKNKREMDYVFDSCYNTLKGSMLITDFYAMIRFVVASVEDGHTNSSLPPAVMNDYINNAQVFPAMVLFINKRAFILCCTQNDSLSESELLSIDNHSMHEIIQRLFAYIQSDAGIESRKNWELPENFQLLYEILYGSKQNFEITIKIKSGIVQTFRVHADYIKNILCAHPFVKPDKYLRLEYKSGNIALLTIRSFFDGFLTQTNENFSKFLDSAFSDIRDKKVSKLVIDIRSNQGGNDINGILLYAYLVQKPFRYYFSQMTVTEEFSESDHSNLGLQKPMEKNYAGKVFVLANGRSFSGAAEFSSIVKANKRGVFIGEQCGGGYYGNTSGDEVNVTLPYSQIAVRIPMIKYTMAVQGGSFTGKGITPDYIFYPTITDIAEKKDSQMEFGLKIAAKKIN